MKTNYYCRGCRRDVKKPENEKTCECGGELIPWSHYDEFTTWRDVLWQQDADRTACRERH